MSAPKRVKRSREPYERAGPEVKCSDTLVISSSPIVFTTNTNDDIVPLGLVLPGPAYYQRIGRLVNMMKLCITGVMVFQMRTVQTVINNMVAMGDSVRLAVVYDRQPSGVLPIFSDIFGGYIPGNGLFESWPYSLLNPVNASRFEVLHDKWHSFNQTGLSYLSPATDTYQEIQVPININVELGGRRTVYNGNVDPDYPYIADVSSGALYLVMRTLPEWPNPSVETEGPTLASLVCRVEYLDN